MNRRRFRLLAPTLMTFTGQVMIPPIPFSAPTLILPTHYTYPSVHEWTPPSRKPESLPDRSVLVMDSRLR